MYAGAVIFPFELMLMLLLFSSCSIAAIILKEKHLRTYSRICASSVTPQEYLLANILTNITILLLQIIIIIICLNTFLDLSESINYPRLFIILVSFCLYAVGPGLFIMGISKSSNSSGVLGSLRIVPGSLLAGCFRPREIMPKILQRLS